MHTKQTAYLVELVQQLGVRALDRLLLLAPHAIRVVGARPLLGDQPPLRSVQLLLELRGGALIAGRARLELADLGVAVGQQSLALVDPRVAVGNLLVALLEDAQVVHKVFFELGVLGLQRGSFATQRLGGRRSQDEASKMFQIQSVD